ncbi:hypothetical protein ANCCAN_26164 [Ancylostoma caninum]|uniref:DUF4440 domain-containing protein n=1 Tax=Ancylostoma caninum TaxID=29170 RepID=A0A368FAT2_ANCCA|nr:hypothetical protein ANCCAN_26164 [Ancylostoma caninum]
MASKNFDKFIYTKACAQQAQSICIVETTWQSNRVKVNAIGGKVGPYYEPDAELVHMETKRTRGREKIVNGLKQLNKMLGQATTKVSNEHYQMIGDAIFLSADFETDSEKRGKIKGKFTQAWRKTNDKYMIFYDEFSTEA